MKTVEKSKEKFHKMVIPSIHQYYLLVKCNDYSELVKENWGSDRVVGWY